MMSKRWASGSVALSLLIGAAVSAGCGGSGAAASGQDKSSPIVVGLIQPYTGDAAFYGKYADNAWTMAVRDFGGKVGDRPIRVVKADSKCEPASATVAANEVVAKHPITVIAPECSGDTLAMLPLLGRQSIPVIAPDLAPQITSQGNDHVWRTAVSDAQTNKLFAQYIASKGVKRIGIIHDTTSYGQSNAKTMSDALTALGKRPVAQASYDFGDTDYSGQILKLKQAKVDAAYFEGYDLQEANLIKQARSLGLNIPIYAPTTANSPTFANAAGAAGKKNVTFVTSFLPTWSPDATTFAKRWEQQFGYPANEDSSILYDSAALAIQALKKVGPDVTADKLNDAIKGIRLTGLPQGTLEFGPNGDRTEPPVIVGAWNGKNPVQLKILSQPK